MIIDAILYYIKIIIVTLATKEAAFVYALTSAVTVYTVTKACSAGIIEGCGCDTSLNGVERPQGGQWGGCSDNVTYGMQFARRFLDARETMVNNNGSEVEDGVGQTLANLHNNEVGRMVSN